MEQLPAIRCLEVCVLLAACLSASIGTSRIRRQLNEVSGSAAAAFSCDVHGPGYFADVAADCEVFHVCHTKYMDTFSCPPGTRFNQKTFVCDWKSRVNCGISQQFFTLNSRIGSAQPFHTSEDDTSVFFTPGSPSSSAASARQPGLRVPAASTNAHEGSFPRISAVPQRQQRLDVTARSRDDRRTAGNARAFGDVRSDTNALDFAGTSEQVGSGSILLPNMLSVNEPSFIGLDVDSRRPVAPPAAAAERQPAPPAHASTDRQQVGGNRKSDDFQTVARSFPNSISETGTQRPSYLPKEATSLGERGRPEGRNVDRFAPLNLGLPSDNAASFSSISLLRPNSLTAGLSDRDEYAPPVNQPTPAPLPPLNLLPLSNNVEPLGDARLPSTTPSYGILAPRDELQRVGGAERGTTGVDAGGTLPGAIPRDFRAGLSGTTISGGGSAGISQPAKAQPQRAGTSTTQKFSRPALQAVGENTIGGASKTGKARVDQPEPRITPKKTPSRVPEPSHSTAPPPPADVRRQFAYNLDAVLRGLQQRLRDVEPHDVPAASAPTRRASTTTARDAARVGAGAPPPAYLYHLPLVAGSLRN